MDDTARQEAVEAIVEAGRLSLAEIEAATGLPHGRIQAIVQDLRSEDGVSVEQETKTTYVLTEKGSKALNDGLPEQQLCDLLEDGPASMEKAQKAVDAFNIALGVCKQHGLVEISERDGEPIMRLIDDAASDSFGLTESLKDVRDGNPPRQRETLLDRGLIEQQEQTETVTGFHGSGKNLRKKV